MYNHLATFHLMAIILIPIVMALDMLDGYVARAFSSSTEYGSLYDILADRIIAFALFIFFVSVNVCSFWAALIIVMRGLILDNIRCIAFKHGIQAFSNNKFNAHALAHILTQSYFSRGLYNSLKTVLFTIFAIQYCYGRVPISIINAITWATVAWGLIRAIPVFYMGNQLINKRASS
ncbi:MAG: CDP-alcohol phosphatidyltransferase family protein [Coxiellaceae bacterium]|nr:CDP-alcohol phosphatidyltransferase family protein [Coxiellaceae bacterium]